MVPPNLQMNTYKDFILGIKGHNERRRSPDLWRVRGKKASCGYGLVDRVAACKLSESPAGGRGVVFGVLDHELNIPGLPCNERLFTAKDFVVFFRPNVAPGQPGNDCAIRERKT